MSFRNDLAAFLGPEIVARDIEYRGNTRTFHFRVLGGDDVEKIFQPGKEKVGFRSKVIAAVVCLEDGRNAFTREEAASLPNAFQNALIDDCFDVNGIRTKAGQPSSAEAEAGNEPSA